MQQFHLDRLTKYPGSEGTTGRALTYTVNSIAATNMTVASCTEACYTAGYILAGVEYASQCCEQIASTHHPKLERGNPDTCF